MVLEEEKKNKKIKDISLLKSTESVTESQNNHKTKIHISQEKIHFCELD